MKKPVVIQEIKNITSGYVRLTKTKDLDFVDKETQQKGKYIKLTTMQIRVGVDPRNMASVQARVAEKGETTGELPWGHWLAGYEGYIIEHDPTLKKRLAAYDKAIAAGESPEKPVGEWKYYLRAVDAKTKSKPRSIYLNEDGEEVSYEEVASKVAPSKLSSSESDVYAIDFDNIVSLEQKHKAKRQKRQSKGGK